MRTVQYFLFFLDYIPIVYLFPLEKKFEASKKKISAFFSYNGLKIVFSRTDLLKKST